MSAPEPTTTPTSLRLPKNLLDRAERLVGPLGALCKTAGQISATRSDVLRLALARGLTELEFEHGTRRRR